MPDVPEVRPASTVVLLRDTPGGLQTLMLKRNKALIFAGGAWVFPGGSLDPEDIEAGNGDLVAASRIAAAREAQEESGLSPHLEDMVLLSHWTTPVGEPRRFSTWIYAAPLAADIAVEIDGSEIHDHKWLRVREAVEEHEAGRLHMLPPTYVTLQRLSHYDDLAQMIQAERHSPAPEVFPVFASDGDQIVVMFRGDAGYDSGNGSVPGARHRAVLAGERWQYQYRDVDTCYPPLIEPAI
ncbi:MAG: NUDIX hydrolase [Halioglobus sp.]|nr:NUDIX hydrolase [Halioglobus sp.]